MCAFAHACQVLSNVREKEEIVGEDLKRDKQLVHQIAKRVRWRLPEISVTDVIYCDYMCSWSKIRVCRWRFLSSPV